MTTSPLRRPLYEGGMSPASAEVSVPRASRGVTVLPELVPWSLLLASDTVAVLESPPPEETRESHNESSKSFLVSVIPQMESNP